MSSLSRLERTEYQLVIYEFSTCIDLPTKWIYFSIKKELALYQVCSEDTISFFVARKEREEYRQTGRTDKGESWYGCWRIAVDAGNRISNTTTTSWQNWHRSIPLITMRPLQSGVTPLMYSSDITWSEKYFVLKCQNFTFAKLRLLAAMLRSWSGWNK